MSFEVIYSDKRSAMGTAALAGFAQFRARLDFRWSKRAGLYEMMVPRLREKHAPTPERLFRTYATRLRRTWRSATADVVERALWEMTDAGMKMAPALRPLIPRDEFAIINAGEVSGDLATALELLLDLRRRTRRIVGATVRLYGTILIYSALLYATLYIIANYAIKSLESFATLSGGPPTASQQYLIEATDWVSGPGPALAGLTFLILTLLTIGTLTVLTGPLRVWLERLPPWSTYRAIQGYIWLSTYVVLVRSGRPETQVIEEQAERSSPWLRERLLKIADLMGQHALLFPVALEQSGFNFPSPNMIDDIANAWGGQNDAYDRLLASSRTWADEIEKRALFRAETMKGVGMVVMYLIVGLLGIAINEFVPINL